MFLRSGRFAKITHFVVLFVVLFASQLIMHALLQEERSKPILPVFLIKFYPSSLRRTY